MDKQAKRKTFHATLALVLTFAPFTAMAMTEVESEEVVISATKTEKKLQEVPATVTVVNARETAQYGYGTIADMVQDVPGVEVFDNSVAGSKRLMIRGENGGRVIVLIDGQKISEQKSMDGAPLLVDPAVVERIEVVKGSGSVLYGSDAIGGVVNIITKKGGDKPLSGDVAGVYRSGTRGYEGSLGLAGGNANVRYRLTGSYSDQGDRETPDGTLEGSESTTKNISGFVGYRTDGFDSGLTLEKYEVAADVPPTPLGPGMVMDINLPEWARTKAGAFVDFTDLSELITKVHVDAYYQKTFKDFRQDMEMPMEALASQGGRPGKPGRPDGGSPGHPGGSPGGTGGHPGGKAAGHPGGPAMKMMPATITQNMKTENDQQTYAVNGQVDMAVTDTHYLIGGAAMSYDTLDATTDIGFSLPFIPARSISLEANVKNWALYLQDEWNVIDDVTVTFGVRETWVESELDNTSNPRLKTGSITDSHPAFSAGITWNTSEDLTLRGLFSQGYRFPDLTKLFIGTEHGGAVTLANPDLDPETSNNFEVGARFADGHLKADVALFYSDAENYINRKTLRPGYNRFENVDTAITYGAEFWVGYRFDLYNLQPYVNATMMRREYEDGDFNTWKTNTPLFSGRVGVRGEKPMDSMVSRIWGDLYIRSASEAEQEDRFGKVDTNDAWTTLNLSVGTSWGENDKWQASINLNNIFDKSYTTAQNSLEEEGINVVARLAVSF